MQSFPISGSPSCSWWIRCAGGCFHCRLEIPGLGWFSSSTRAPPPALSQAFPITSWLVLNPLAPTFPINFGGTALWLLEGCLCVPEAAPDVTGWWQSWNSQVFCGCCLQLVLPMEATTTAQGQAGRKRSQKGKLGVCLSKCHGSELVAIIP